MSNSFLPCSFLSRESKRSSDQAGNADDIDTKRLKRDVTYEFELCGDTYIDFVQLARTPPFTAYFVKMFEKYSVNLGNGAKICRHSVLEKKHGKIKDVIDRIRDVTPSITEEELALFKDALGSIYQVVMRIVAQDFENEAVQIAKMQLELMTK